MKFAPKLAMLLLAISATTSAYADRPLETETADIIERSHCEVELVGIRTRTQGEARGTGWDSESSCGIGYDSQITIEYGRSHTGDSHGSDNPGVDHARSWQLAGKTAVIPRKEEEGSGLTVAWAFGADRSSLDTRQYGNSELKLVLSSSLREGLTGHANLGWAYTELDHVNALTWNLALEQEIGAGVDLTAEVFGDNHGTPTFALGARWTLSKHLNFDLAWDRQNGSPKIDQYKLGVRFSF